MFALMFLAACDKNKREALTNGIEYIHHVKGTGEKAKDGEVISLHYSMYVVSNGKDSLLGNTYDAPYPMAVVMGDQSLGPIAEALRLTTSGDSISVFIKADSLFGPQLPPGVDAGTFVRFDMKIAKVQTMEEAEQENEQRMEVQKEKEDKIIATHLSNNNIAAQKTESGLYYVVASQGTGAKPKEGEMVQVHYNGTLLDGTPFDSSYDRGQPLNYAFGIGQMIPGFDEGVSFLNEGGKATLYLPSHLAYGAAKRSEVIQAFSILKFEIELVKVN